jgi:hypothetical protein
MEQASRAERRFQTQVAIARQVRIDRQHNAFSPRFIEPGRFRKRAAMDCGNPRCGVCGNPRRIGRSDPLTLKEVVHRQVLRDEIAQLFARADRAEA